MKKEEWEKIKRRRKNNPRFEKTHMDKLRERRKKREQKEK